MYNLSFHKDFKLNGKSFATVEEILDFTNKELIEVHEFLVTWFSSLDYVMVNTSGSTGTPKSIALQKQNMLNSAEATSVFFNIRAKTRALLCLSPSYIAGKMMLVRALSLGWHLDIIKPVSNPLENCNSTYDFCAMVPLQLENSVLALHQIKQLIVGGGAVSEVLIKKTQNTTCKVYATYGMTETITHIAIKKLNNYTNQPQFFKVLKGVQLYKDTRDCLVIYAPKVAEKIIFTNDVVELLSDNEFCWLGRYDNVVNSGGIKLYPEIIESKLATVISGRFFVIGINDHILGDKLVLIVEGDVRELNIEAANLSKYEKPKATLFVEKFVNTPTQKIQRKKTLKLALKTL